VGPARPAKLAGTQVRLNGAPAPLVLATPTALVVQAPADIDGDSAELEVISGSIESTGPRTIRIIHPPAQ
jgi:uncharacterized protein (TIGR03437 family)